MGISKTSKLTQAVAMGALAGALALGGASGALAQSYRHAGLEPVVGCDAPGGKQLGGAVLGALLGAVAGSNLAKNDRGTGTAIGAVTGAAAGSYVGCRMQRGDANREAYGYAPAYAQRPATYNSGGYRLDSAIQPARLVRDDAALVAASTVNLRAAPTTGAPRVGQLRAGERFQSLARVRGGDWILVGQGGVRVGYVHAAYVRPEGARRYAAYGY
jgi:hypothetical protein